MPNVYKFHCIITTFEVIITDLELLRQIDWRVSVIDEAHRLKNRNCKLLQGLYSVDVVSGGGGGSFGFSGREA